MENVIDAIKKFSDFIDAVKKISPNYEKMFEICLLELIRRMK